MPPALIDSRTRLKADPVRNFKYQVQLFSSVPGFETEFAKIGFMSVEGLAMNTEMVPYREGGWNTNPHKLPGQTDFAPLTMSAGVFYQKPGMWNLAKRMFSVQWGGGTIGMDEDFRFNMAVRVLDHPVTDGKTGSAAGGKDISSAVIGFAFYNCWAGSIGFNGLNAMDNAILIHQMTVHHEGFDVYFGNHDAVALEHAGARR
jgi:phage tail-like protein